MASLFASRNALWIHLVQIVLILIAVGITLYRLFFIKTGIRSRANTMALGMGAKSLIIILYQILSEHTKFLRKWASLKANAILNTLEIVFWAAVVFLMIQANLQACTGVGCILSWIVAVLAGLLSLLAVITSIISIKDFRYYKKNGVHRGSHSVEKVEDIETGDIKMGRS